MPGQVFWLLRVSVILALGAGAGGRKQTGKGPPHVLTVTDWSQ